MTIVNAAQSAFACPSSRIPVRQRVLRVSVWLPLILSMAFLTASHTAEAATLWAGPKVVFGKFDGANPALADNQDRLTANVWLTRGASQGLYNAARESSFTHSLSPADTEWATGTTANYQTLRYTDWDTWAASVGKPPDTVGVNAVLHLKTDDIYLDIKFLSWSQHPPSGGFSYERSTAGVVDPTSSLLSINTVGPGLVTSIPAGINCGTSCSASFASGTGVTLTATPASGSAFAGWSGDCSGTGSCTLAMNTAKNISASFSLSAPTCTLSANPSSISAGGSTMLSASCSPAATSYSWSANTGFGSTVAIGTIAPSSSSTYSVRGINAAGTGNTASVTVSVATAATPASYSGLWWNANESGWGMSVTQHGNINFVAVFTYDQAGLPAWYVISNCPMSGNTCSGDLYSVSGGTPPTTPWNGSAKVVTRAGSGTLSFTNSDNGRFAFDINGVGGLKAITRQPIAAGAVPTVDYTDLWWNPDESGWGISLTQQSNTIFAAWYAYDARGNAIWYVASNCAVAGNVCTGPLYRVAGGSPATAAWNGANLTVTAVGTVNINFTDSGNAVMSYSIEGVAGSRSIVRQPF